VLAATPSALASHSTEVHVRSATLGPLGGVTVTGTILCTAGYRWDVGVSVRQRAGSRYHTAGTGVGGVCASDGLLSWSTALFFAENRPFKTGAAVASANGSVCDPFFGDCAFDSDTIVVRLRK
jgi:hypothetical protein